MPTDDEIQNRFTMVEANQTQIVFTLPDLTLDVIADVPEHQRTRHGRYSAKVGFFNVQVTITGRYELTETAIIEGTIRNRIESSCRVSPIDIERENQDELAG